MEHLFYPYDLHSHSQWSDGDLKVDELVRLANQSGLSALALADHATINGWQKFSRLCSEFNINTVLGTETMAICGNFWFDVLLYGFNPNNNAIQEILARHVKALDEVCVKYTAWLQDNREFDITWEKVIGHYKTPSETVPSLYLINKYRRDILGVPHKSIGSDIREARVRQIDRGEIYQKYLLHISDVVKVVSQAGGIVSLAHPIKTAAMLSRLTKKGICQCLEELLNVALQYEIQALEVRHSFHSQKDAKKLILFAQEYNLLITGGSDYHGDRPGGHKENVRLGYPGLSKKEFKRFIKNIAH